MLDSEQNLIAQLPVASNFFRFQADNKIVVLINSSEGAPTPVIYRFMPDGTTPDPTFVQDPSINYGWSNSLYNLHLTPEGKIYVMGTLQINGVSRRLFRLNTDGSLDTDFFAQENNYPTAFFMADGKILLKGNFNPALKRLNEDGTLDSSFRWTNNPDYNVIQDIRDSGDGNYFVLGTGLSSINNAIFEV